VKKPNVIHRATGSGDIAALRDVRLQQLARKIEKLKQARQQTDPALIKPANEDLLGSRAVSKASAIRSNTPSVSQQAGGS
jgi:hypothetical protein